MTLKFSSRLALRVGRHAVGLFGSQGWAFTRIVPLSAVTKCLCAIGEFGAQGVLQFCFICDKPFS